MGISPAKNASLDAGGGLSGDAEQAITGVHFVGDGREPNQEPEVWLWRAVVARAFEDAFGTGPVVGERHTADHEAVRAESWRWLTTDLEPWRTARELVCQAAGFHAEQIRQIARTRGRPQGY